MRTKEFINYLKSLDINLHVNEDKLRVDAPKGSLTVNLRREIGSRKEEILTDLRPPQKLPLERISREGNLPLYFAQERFWFFDKFEPNSSAYNIPLTIQMKGKLNIIALEKSINEIVRRHEILRSSCPTFKGKPKLTIIPHLTLSLVPRDVSEPEVEKKLIADAQTPFDLSVAPLFRVSLWRLNSEYHILLINLYHFVADGLSIQLLKQELSTLYQAFSRSLPSPLKDFSIQYVDFAHWQQQQLEKGKFEKQLSYWKQQLAGSSFVLDLPGDRPRPPIQTYNGSSYSFSLSPELSTAVEKLSRQKGVTLFMTLLATFQILLYRYTQQEDLIVATTVSNRQKLELEQLIGSFANNILLRANLAGNLTFSEFIEQVKKTAIDAYAHQDFPFEKLVEILQPHRDLSRHPLFQVLFIWHQNIQQDFLKLPEITWTQLPNKLNVSRWDLSLSMSLNPQNQLSGNWNYNTDLFNKDRLERMTGHFQTLLEGIVANPNSKVTQLRLLSEAERHQLLVEWNDTEADYPKDKCIHQLFEEQVERTPDAVAVGFEEKQLTYRELNIKANQLANYLQKLGVKAETLVGICVERSLEMVVGLLGILKAGVAYVPLDPAYPQERLNYILNDTQISLLLTQQHLVGKIPQALTNIICLDRDKELIFRDDKTNCTPQVKSDNLAYVIYTSGSTGQPKGVMIEHQGAVNTIYFRITKQFSPENLASVPFFISISFDGSIAQLFSTLAVGGKITIIDNIFEVNKFNEMEKFTIIFATPSLLEKYLTHYQLPNSIKLVCVGGEETTNQLTQKLDQYPNIKKYNIYGPTETSIFCSFDEF